MAREDEDEDEDEEAAREERKGGKCSRKRRSDKVVETEVRAEVAREAATKRAAGKSR